MREKRKRLRKRRLLILKMRRAALLLSMAIVLLGALNIGKYIHAVFVSNRINEVQMAQTSQPSQPMVQESPPAVQEEPKVEETVNPRNQTIVLDAGHGGYDPGCGRDDVVEKDLTLTMVRKAQEKLVAAGFDVELVRDDDTFYSLEERAEYANQWMGKQAAFVSVHVNYLDEDSETNGLEVFCNTTTNPDSGRLAGAIQNRIGELTGEKTRDVRNSSNIYVVKFTKIDACLIETGFLSCDEDYARLVDEEYQDAVAQGICDGVTEFMDYRY